MKNSALIVSFSFEQVPKAFSTLTDAGITPVVWEHDPKAQLAAEELIAFWSTLAPKPRAIVMGADVEITEPFLRQAPELKSISLNCAGYDHVDLDACARHGVTVCNVPRRNFDAVADFAWGEILCLMRNIYKADACIRAGKWCEGVERSAAVSRKTIGIVGMGAIGQAVARRAKGFDMNIVALSTSKKPALAETFGLAFLDGEDFFRAADIVVLCCPHNESTHHLINAQSLAWMKPEAFLVNPSRGGIVDTQALKAALEQGSIAGAALDVFEEEPLFESDLFRLSNVLLTPHIGGLADREIDEVAILSAEHCVATLEGKTPDSKLV